MKKLTLLFLFFALALPLAVFADGGVKSIEIEKSRPQVPLLGEVKQSRIPDSIFYEKVAPIVRKEVLLAAGYISRNDSPYGQIIDTESEDKELLPGDIVYISRGSADGLRIGDDFFIYRRLKVVKDVDDETVLGQMITIIGQLEVIDLNKPKRSSLYKRTVDRKSRSAKCVIKQGYREILKGDLILPIFKLNIPTMDEDRPVEDKLINGNVIAVSDSDKSGTKDDIIYLNVGREDHVAEGDVFGVYNVPVKGTPAGKYGYDRLLGKAYVFTVRKETSTAIISHATEEINRGYAVRFLQER